MTPQLSTNYEAYNELLYEAYKLTLPHLSARETPETNFLGAHFLTGVISGERGRTL